MTLTAQTSPVWRLMQRCTVLKAPLDTTVPHAAG
jgi:hypothetical protein